jgi:hypothetical protein
VPGTLSGIVATTLTAVIIFGPARRGVGGAGSGDDPAPAPAICRARGARNRAGDEVARVATAFRPHGAENCRFATRRSGRWTAGAVRCWPTCRTS